MVGIPPHSHKQGVLVFYVLVSIVERINWSDYRTQPKNLIGTMVYVQDQHACKSSITWSEVLIASCHIYSVRVIVFSPLHNSSFFPLTLSAVPFLNGYRFFLTSSRECFFSLYLVMAFALASKRPPSWS